MESFQRGNIHFIDEDYPKAIESYTEGLQDVNDFAPLYAHRAAACLKLKKYTQALQDCNQAINLDPTNEKAHFRKGVACFELEEYETAKRVFEAGYLLCRPEQADIAAKYARYIRKCIAEIQEAEEEDDVSLSASTSSAVDNQVPAPASVAAPVAAPAPAPAPAPAVTRQPVYVPPPPIRYEYYQNNDRLVISVLVKGLEPQDAVVTIQTNHLQVVVTRNGVREVVIDKWLYGAVDVTASRYEVRKTKVEIILSKVEKFNWVSLEGSPDSAAARAPVPAPPASAAAATAPASTTSDTAGAGAGGGPSESKKQIPRPYASKKDWDAVGSSIAKEMEEEKPEGEDALQKLFRDIYSKADEDTRRAMNKSFQTSGGTVLSTNWKEVGTKNYEEERQAPKGMEWRNWEGEKLKQIE